MFVDSGWLQYRQIGNASKVQKQLVVTEQVCLADRYQRGTLTTEGDVFGPEVCHHRTAETVPVIHS